VIFQTNGGERYNRMSERPQLLLKTIDFFASVAYLDKTLIIAGAKGIVLLSRSINYVIVSCLDAQPFRGFLETGLHK
jgi:hypothetical protein